MTITPDSLMTFGKHAGKPLREVPRVWLTWWHSQNKDKRDDPLVQYIERPLLTDNENMKQKLEQLKTELKEFIEMSKTITRGKWNHWPTHWAGGSNSFRYGIENCPWINADGRDDIARVNPEGVYTSDEPMANATFIARSRNISPAMAECLLVTVEGLERMALWPMETMGIKSAECLQQILTIWEAAK